MKANNTISAAILSVLIASASLLPVFNVSMSNELGESELQGLSAGRTVTFEFYSFFDPGDATMKTDVWEKREKVTGQDHVVSFTYPVVYEWYYQGIKEDVYFYTSGRLNVEARELSEIHIGDPEFLPYNLMGGLPGGVVGGTAQISNWYLDYPDAARIGELGIPSGWWDGYISELRGDVIMDSSATMKVLGITAAQYADIANWWTANEGDVETAWKDWLYYEGNERLKIYPFQDYPLDLELYFDFWIDTSNHPSSVTLSFDIASWGMECLLARWFWETFMPGYEYYYDDFKFNATIGPTTTNLDVDTAVHWLLYAWSYNDTAFADAVWAFEPQLGDLPISTGEKTGLGWDGPYVDSPAYPYYAYDNGTRKTYYYVAPGHAKYAQFYEYDYCPAMFDLGDGETLIVRWGDSWPKGPVYIYKQEPWGEGETPRDTIVQYNGYLNLSDASEPYPYWGTYPQINYNPFGGYLTFTGPLNMTDLSLNEMPEEWDRLADSQHPQGLPPWGEPYIELAVEPLEHDVAIADVTIEKSVLCQGYSCNINVTVQNQGIHTETFDVNVYADLDNIHTETVTLAGGLSKLLALTWDTLGLAKGNYTIRAVADAVPDEADTTDNELSGWVIVSMVGDITGPTGWPDGKCDIRDVALVASKYGAIYPDPKYDPDCDIVWDRKIDIKDIALVAKHYGEVDP